MTTWICEGCKTKNYNHHCVLEVEPKREKPDHCPNGFGGSESRGSLWKETIQYEIKEREPEQSRRYRLEIPNPIELKYCTVASEILKVFKNGGTVLGDQVINNMRVDALPKDWLIPIEPKEMTADHFVKEWENHHYLTGDHVIRDSFSAGVKKGERIEQEKHNPRQTFDEWWSSGGSPLHDDIDFRIAKMVWDSCRISLGYEPE